MFAKDKKYIEAVLQDNYLKQVGIVFSNKLNSTGRSVSGYILKDYLDFLGTTIYPEQNYIVSPKGNISLHSSDKDITKVI